MQNCTLFDPSFSLVKKSPVEMDLGCFPQHAGRIETVLILHSPGADRGQ